LGSTTNTWKYNHEKASLDLPQSVVGFEMGSGLGQHVKTVSLRPGQALSGYAALAKWATMVLGRDSYCRPVSTICSGPNKPSINNYNTSLFQPITKYAEIVETQ
jgi:hypothetical protein